MPNAGTPYPTPSAHRADSLLDEGLTAFLRAHRDDDRRSWEWIARELSFRTERQVEVTGPTVAGWYERLVDTKAAS